LKAFERFQVLWSIRDVRHAAPCAAGKDGRRGGTDTASVVLLTLERHVRV